MPSSHESSADSTRKNSKIFILYASVGSGHFKSAEAVFNYFKEKSRDADIRLIDILSYANPFFKEIYIYGYAFLVKHALWLWSIEFYISESGFFRPLINWGNSVLNRLNSKRFTSFLLRESPDFIISTHFFPSEVSARLKRRVGLKSNLITVITDFDVHPFWINEGTDTYIVASGFTGKILLQEGVRAERIRISGIPIDRKFTLAYNREALCGKLGLDKNKFTVLLITGSFGIGNIEGIVNALCLDYQVLVVCAGNKRLYEKLKRKNYPQVRVFGFIDNIQELMAVSGLIITKPGGLTVSEALAMELPPIFISAIPGQEDGNIKALATYGVGLKPGDIEELKSLVEEYKSCPERAEIIKQGIREIKKPFACEELYNVIRQGGLWPAR